MPTVEALLGAGLMPVPPRPVEKVKPDVVPPDPSDALNPFFNQTTTELYNGAKLTDEAIADNPLYPSLVELKSMVDEQNPTSSKTVITPPSIEPLKQFIERRKITIEGLKDLRDRMAKHILNGKISNTVGNSASIVGGLLCFVFPLVGVPVLLAGTATSLGMFH